MTSRARKAASAAVVRHIHGAAKWSQQARAHGQVGGAPARSGQRGGSSASYVLAAGAVVRTAHRTCRGHGTRRWVRGRAGCASRCGERLQPRTFMGLAKNLEGCAGRGARAAGTGGGCAVASLQLLLDNAVQCGELAASSIPRGASCFRGGSQLSTQSSHM